MKKVLAVSMILGLALALLPVGAAAHYEDDPLVVGLLAGQTEDIGDVKVWNDEDTLYVKFVYTGADCGFLEVHLQVDEGEFSPDILTKKGNPIPGKFEKSYDVGCFKEHTFTYDLAGEGFDYGDDLVIAAHAATGVSEIMWVYSDGDESFTAYSGPGTEANPCEPKDERTGTAVPAWQHPNWSNLSADDPTFAFREEATWIWESEYVQDPVCGTVVDFEETFDIPGEFTDGILWVTADNGYAAYLNGTLLKTDGLSGEWRNSPLTEEYVTTAQAAWSTVEIANWLQLEGNTLRFETANEYYDTDDGHNAPGTVESNPGGLIYQAKIRYYAEGETAWGEGTRFNDKTWATHFPYTVQCNVEYVLDITSLNGSTGYTHDFTIVYDPLTGEISGTGDGHDGTQTLSEFDYTLDEDGVITYIAFRSDYDNTSYYWFPAFNLNDDGRLTFVDGVGDDNVDAATGTWSWSYVCNGG